MKADVKKLSDSEAEITIEATEAKLEELKKITLKRLQPEVSAPGFRKGKAPLNIVEKQVDDNYFKSTFLDDALTELYREALNNNHLRPLSQPQVEIKKFVPFTELSFIVKVEVVPPVTLGDYKKIKKQAKPEKVAAKDIDEVIGNLQKRTAERQKVERAAKDGDEVTIDFKGVDDKGEDVAGATGKDYPLAIGSKSFIDGFEEEVVGMKSGEEKTFTITFPSDYAHKPLANKDVTFTVTAKSVSEIVLPEVDDEFAAKVGPFKTVAELKEDVKKQLEEQKAQEADSKLKDEILEELVGQSKMTVPKVMLDENMESMLAEFKQNLVYRGITFPEYLEQAGITEEEYKEKELKERAEIRVQTGLVLAEVAKAENIEVTPEELEVRMQILKGQYAQDPQMAAQFENPDAAPEIASRMVTEKTVDKLVEYATK